MATTFVFREPAYYNLVKSFNGPVGKDLHKRAVKVHNAAWRTVGVDTGELRQSLRIVRGHSANGDLKYSVGSDNWKALLHHQGVKDFPTIRPTAPTKALQFTGSNGIIIYRHSTEPREIKPNQYLLDNLHLAII